MPAATQSLCLQDLEMMQELSLIHISMEWEENVYFFRQEEPGHFDFEEENVSIYGLSYWHREIGEPV